MAGPEVLRLHDVRVSYGNVSALEGVSFEVRRGEIVGLLGPNGSGKSTTLKVAAGLLEPASGTVTVGSLRHPRAAHLIGYVPQDHALYDELTARENLAFFGRLYGYSGADLRRRCQRVLEAVDLAGRAGDRVGGFSGGMKQRLNLAASLLHEPALLLLDEPTAALDPASRDALFARLTRLRDEGHAILLSTHHLDEAEQSCDRVGILEQGRLTAIERPGDLLRPPVGGKSVLIGMLRAPMPKFLERALHQRLDPQVILELTGRRLRLTADSSDELGRSLAFLLAAGVEFESFSTPAGSLERALRSHSPIVQVESCGIGSR